MKVQNTFLAQSLANLEAWLESMRQVGGYGGPVNHIWRTNLLYCGPMLDWRYEGIILGYIELYRKTRGAIWLDKARRAGLDLVHGQYPCGNFKNSSFERGPTSGGTPHEASADVGLLNLAELLKEEDDPSWSIFYDSAAKNIELYLIKYLWNGEFFRDLPNSNFHVANKTATMVEVMLAYHQFLRHIDEHRAQSILKLIKKAADSILALQHPHGGIAQSSRRRDCYTFYTARCIWPLIQFYKVDDHERYREAAKKAGDFILGMARPEGGSGMLSEAAAKMITEHGGSVLTESEVGKIIADSISVLRHNRSVELKRGLKSSFDKYNEVS